jgi:phage tail-like protein
MATARDIPYSGFNFKVVVSGGGVAITGKFSEVSGIETNQDVIEYRSGEDPTLGVTKIPGLAKYSNLTLRRGVLGGTDLTQWRQQAIEGRVIGNLATVTVQLLNEQKTQVLSWVFKNAWPVRWTGPTLAGARSETAVESLEVAYESVTVE